MCKQRWCQLLTRRVNQSRVERLPMEYRAGGGRGLTTLIARALRVGTLEWQRGTPREDLIHSFFFFLLWKVHTKKLCPFKWKWPADEQCKQISRRRIGCTWAVWVFTWDHLIAYVPPSFSSSNPLVWSCTSTKRAVSPMTRWYTPVIIPRGVVVFAWRRVGVHVE